MPFATINNAGFELQSAPPNPTPSAIYGWSQVTGTTSVGVYAPGVAYYTSGPPEGTDVATLVTVASFRQRTPYKFKNGVTYTLSVKFGWAKTIATAPVYNLYLLTSDTDTILVDKASPGSVAPALVQDDWVTASVTFTAGAGDEGKFLTVAFASLSVLQLDVDDITLEVEDDSAFGDTVALDDMDPGASVVAGVWASTTQTLANGYWDGSAQSVADSTAQFQWKPTLPVGAKYSVRVHIPNVAAAINANASYAVNHSGGVTNVAVDQEAVDDSWVELGEFYFAAGDTGYVQLSTSTAVLLVADVVAWQVIVLHADAPVPGVGRTRGAGTLTAEGIGNPDAPLTGVQRLRGVGTVGVVVPGGQVTPGVLGVQRVRQVGALSVLAIKIPVLEGVQRVRRLGVLRASVDVWIPEPKPNPAWNPGLAAEEGWSPDPAAEAGWTQDPGAS